MGARNVGTALLAMRALLSNPISHASAEETNNDINSSVRLRRKRSTGSYRSSRLEQTSGRRLTMDEDLQRFFLPTKQDKVGVIDEEDMRELLQRMNLELSSMSIVITEPPTPAPTESLAPTVTNCDNPGTCENRLTQQIYDVSVRVGTVDTLSDPNSAQSRASAWILEQCGSDPPIDPCDVSLLNLNEQRYALAVMYFSLTGDEWNNGANPGLDPAAPAGQWMSGLNYCEWGADVTGEDGSSYKQLVCDEFGNVLELNLRESSACFCNVDAVICIKSYCFTFLLIESNNMVGPIAPEIGVLQYMTSYISFFNAQEGPIPTSLGLITSLQTFDVESNNMDGDLFKPEYSGPDGLKEIVNFRTSLNNFVGSIPTEIGLWSKLQNLWFADNEVSGTLPSEIGNCADMREWIFVCLLLILSSMHIH